MSFMARPSCFLLLYVTSTFADQSQIAGKPRDDVTLQCHSHRDADIIVLEWIRLDLRTEDYVFFYRNRRSYENFQHESFRGRVELKDPEMKNGDVSVILKNININDAGTYECRVINSNRERFNKTTNLIVEPDNAAEQTLGEGKTEKSITGGGSKDVNVGLVAGLSVVVLFLCFIGFMMYKKHQKLPSYQPPPEKAAEQQQV